MISEPFLYILSYHWLNKFNALDWDGNVIRLYNYLTYVKIKKHFRGTNQSDYNIIKWYSSSEVPNNVKNKKVVIHISGEVTMNWSIQRIFQ